MLRKQNLQRNILYFTLIRVFFKRAYLPVITLFAVDHADVSLVQIGVIAAIVSLASLVLEIPSGYISDKMGHKNALVFGSFLVTIAPLFFIFLPNFIGVLMGSLLFFAGVAFHSGTLSAFMHDTLRELGRESAFGQIAARAQKIGLFVFTILIALVPMTYSINQTFPFILGFLSHAVVLVASLLMTVPRRESRAEDTVNHSFFSLLGELIKDRRIFTFFFLGLSASILHKLPEYQSLYLEDIGMAVVYLGVIFAAGNLLGAVMLHYIKYFERLSHRGFYALDTAIVIFLLILLGFLPVVPVAVFAFTVVTGYTRLRQVVITAHLVSDCPTNELKATYLSIFEFFASFNRIWVPLVLGYTTGQFGIVGGYGVFAIIFIVILIILFLVLYRQWR